MKRRKRNKKERKRSVFTAAVTIFTSLKFKSFLLLDVMSESSDASSADDDFGDGNSIGSASSNGSCNAGKKKIKGDGRKKKASAAPFAKKAPLMKETTPSIQTKPPLTFSNDVGEDITRGPNVTTEASAKKLILLYLHQQNRPFSSIQVFDNLHKRVAKAVVEKVLQNLSEDTASTHIRCKEYGKAKLFWSEEANKTLTYTNDDLDALEGRVETLRAQVEDQTRVEKALRLQLAEIQSSPRDSDLMR